MNKNDYAHFNEILEDRTKDLDGVNFIRYISADPDKKCSVVCHYVHELTDGFYYGLHPQLSPERVLNKVKIGKLKNHESLLELMKDFQDFFSLHDNQEQYKEAIFAKVLLRMASRFGVVFQCEAEAAEGLIKHIQMNKDLFITNVTYKVLDHEADSKIIEIALLGGVTDEAAKYLDQSTYAIALDEGSKKLKLVTKEYKGSRKFVQLYELIADMKTIEAFSLCYGNVYYSGVLPKVLKLEKIDSYSNQDIQTLKLHVERTTFATVDAFDYCDIIQHPLLRPYVDILNNFEQNEDKAQKLLYSKANYESKDKMISAINAYLEASYNTHIVAVSGNIITKDNSLIVAKRHKGSIDNGTYYCSVNGQSEFRDYGVSFYKESVNADYPSMVADPSFRNDFSEELNRETLAELNVNELKRNWEYYGLAILGIRNDGDEPKSFRRMHFNVLAFNSTDEDLQSIIELRDDAPEKFENQLVEGVRLRIYHNTMDKIKALGVDVLTFFQEYDLIISYTLGFLFLFLTGLNFKVEPGNVLEITKSISTYVLAFFALLNSIIKLSNHIKTNKKVRPYLSVHSFTATNNAMKNVENFSNKVLKNVNCHPILQLMLLLHLYKRFTEE